MLIDELKKFREELIERIEGQKKALDYFDKLIKTLESANPGPWKEESEPLFDPYKEPVITKIPPFCSSEPTEYNSCSKCGLSLKYMTNYYCPRNECPTFVKATC